MPCYYSDWGNEVAHNTFTDNGGYGNVTNGDIADLSTIPPSRTRRAPGNCFSGNTEIGGGKTKTWPTYLQTSQKNCHNPFGYPDPASTAVLGAQVICATQAFFSCPSNVVANYPRRTTVVMHPLPHQQTMPNPCAGVPQNPWCPNNPPAPALSAHGHELPNARPQAAVRPAST